MPFKNTKTKLKFKVNQFSLFNSKSKTVEDELKIDQFRVSVFGSARIQENDKVYKQVKDLSKMIGEQGFDIVTGGGPGLMSAANLGHEEGDRKNKADSIGLTIRLPWETDDNKHLEIKKHFNRFSDRLDNFMALSNVVVVTPGGIGTCLELFYTWQLIQVRHICPIPVILIGDMWKELINWVKAYPLKKGLISPEDMNCIYVVKDNKEAMKIIMKANEVYKKHDGDYCSNINLYKLDTK